MAVLIRGLGKAVPEKIITNAELAPTIDSTDEWIRSHSGIAQRHVAGPGETVSDFGAMAVEAALERAGVKAVDLDLLLCATSTPQYLNSPCTGCVIQRKVGASKAAAWDTAAACTGFITAVSIADALLQHRGWRYAVVVGAELVSTIIDWKDRGNCFLFGDGAGAVVLENVPGETNKGIGSVILGSDGNGERSIYLDENRLVRMDGQAVYQFATAKIGDILKDLMDQEGLGMDDVDYFVCHQANERILQAAEKRLHIPPGKMVYNIANYGNTSSSTVPIALTDMVDDGRLKAGMTIVTAGFGAGLTWGGLVVRF
jgi:3-oxoacyl-[acyl-carrier-protein] synthase-3